MSSHLTFAQQAPGAEGYQYDHPAAAHVKVLDRQAGTIDGFLKERKKIGICGFASSSRDMIPLNDRSWLLGGMNQLARHIARFDYYYDIHANWQEGNVEGTDHPKWIRECGIPVFMVDPPADAPTALRYPIERMIQKFGVDYFTSTVSYMIAWAIDEIDQAVEARTREMPPTFATNGHAATTAADVSALVKSVYAEYTIGIFGIDLIVGDEYDFQKACAEFWLGQADARGITVAIPPQSALLKHRWRYGYEAEPTGGILKVSDYEARRRDIQARIAKVQEVHQRTIAELQTLDGALQEITHHLNVIDLRSKGGQIPLAAG